MRQILLTLTLLVVACGHQSKQNLSLKPTFLTFGSSVADIVNKLEPLCERISIRNISPLTAASTQRQQLDCYGFSYFDKKRNVELVFQEGQLDLVWILYPESEQNEFIQRFETAYGEPDLNVEFGLIYLQHNAAIRYQPSKILFASERQINIILKTLKHSRLVSKRIHRIKSLI